MLVITNPIELGENIDSKDYVPGIRVELNQKTLINLEMQTVNEGNWVERSLCYLYRAFDNLNRGDDYINVRPAIHIGILSFPLFPEHPEFYATYQFQNIRKRPSL